MEALEKSSKDPEANEAESGLTPSKIVKILRFVLRIFKMFSREKGKNKAA